MLGPPAVSAVMHRTVRTVDPQTSALAAARLLREADVGSVVVVADGEGEAEGRDSPDDSTASEGAVVGVVTEADVVALVADERGPDTPVAELLSAPVRTVSADATLVEAAERMRDHRVGTLPVVGDGALVGILTRADVSNHLPHARHVHPEVPDDGERVRQTAREDTAYEREDWDFEYVGHEAAIDVGDVVRFSKTLSTADVEAFAEASGDTNRLHLEDDYAAGTRFGRRIAHGTLVAGVVSAALARLPGLVIYLSQEVSYLGPVDVDERVTAECEVVEDVGEGRYRLRTTVTDSDGETVVDGEAVVVADEVPETA